MHRGISSFAAFIVVRVVSVPPGGLSVDSCEQWNCVCGGEEELCE